MLSQEYTCYRSGGQDVAGSRTGLSIGHISPRSVDAVVSRGKAPSLEFPRGGNLVTVRGVSPETPGKSRRNPIVKFSRSSRNRLVRLLASIDRENHSLPLFLTLTYPAAYSEDATRWKRDLDSFFKALERRMPGAASIWRLEFQKRGAPHFHILTFSMAKCQQYDNWRGFQEWVSETWYRIVGSGDPKHLKAGTRVERVRSWRGVMSYCSKYLGKLPEDGAPVPVGAPGRFWGVRNRAALGIELLRFALTMPEFYKLRRTLRKLIAKRNVYLPTRNRYSGVTAFTGNATGYKLLQLLC